MTMSTQSYQCIYVSDFLHFLSIKLPSPIRYQNKPWWYSSYLPPAMSTLEWEYLLTEISINSSSTAPSLFEIHNMVAYKLVQISATHTLPIILTD